jgi:hypothetical protein
VATIQYSDGVGASQPFATHPRLLPRAADVYITRMIREANRARLTTDAALLLS